MVMGDEWYYASKSHAYIKYNNYDDIYADPQYYCAETMEPLTRREVARRLKQYEEDQNARTMSFGSDADG